MDDRAASGRWRLRLVVNKYFAQNKNKSELKKEKEKATRRQAVGHAARTEKRRGPRAIITARNSAATPGARTKNKRFVVLGGPIFPMANGTAWAGLCLIIIHHHHAPRRASPGCNCATTAKKEETIRAPPRRQLTISASFGRVWDCDLRRGVESQRSPITIISSIIRHQTALHHRLRRFL